MKTKAERSGINPNVNSTPVPLYGSVPFIFKHLLSFYFYFFGGKWEGHEIESRVNLVLILIPELGEGASCRRLSIVIPGGSLCSILNDDDMDATGDPLSCKQDVEDPLPLT